MTHSIYISGPIMARNPDRPDGLVTELLLAQRRRKFNEVAEVIRDNVDANSTLVINPLDIEACKDGTTSPTCEGLESGRHSWQCYLRYDLEQLVMCDEVVMLEGWEGSPGANVEKQVADFLGLEVSYWCNYHNNAHGDGPCKMESA